MAVETFRSGQNQRDQRGDDDPYAGTGLPELGFRNYWYPVMAAWRLGRKPKAVKVLG